MTDDAPDPPAERDEISEDVRNSLEAILTDDASTHRLDQLHRVARQITECSTETAIYDNAIAGAYDLFDVRYAVVAIPRGDQWVTVTSTRCDPNVRFGQAAIINAEIERALDRNETALIEDVSEATDGAVPFENGRALCAPIGDAGMLQFVTDGGDFDEADVRYSKLLGWITAARLEQLALTEEVASMEDQLTSFADFGGEVFEQTSHDLRTPLTTIIGYMELLADEEVGSLADEEVGSLSDEQREFTQLVLRKATELDAAIETLTSSFDTRLANMRAGRHSLPETDQMDVPESDDGPFVFLSLDTGTGTLLAEQLTDLGYEVTVADDPAGAREAIRRTPSSTLVVELFATGDEDGTGNEPGRSGGDEHGDEKRVEDEHGSGEDEIEYGNGLTLAETIRREEGSEETTVRVVSIFRDESADVAQLGASAYVPERADPITEAVELLLGVGDEEQLHVLVFDTAGTETSGEELPANWEATTVTDIDAARTAAQTALYDLALVRTDALSGREREIVRTLRERQHGRRLPVVLVDRESTVTDAWYVLGGKLFIQRPITAADLMSMLISEPMAENDGPTTEGDSGGPDDS
ncbi:histidine kinase dimerization/phospho-acceptor domain-containing protein [Natronorubrum halophilum]|uniref:histidine kinase dimerization/phospho-acceptor domain-containing protein n=1 Tax=Natronorubrum halophilum TaxID=1702106 RepID=UPI0010C22A8F|nr:histidine kinase dimerization/phospho-acceptor domain-containing protein [Natronorubrum halophilum]